MANDNLEKKIEGISFTELAVKKALEYAKAAGIPDTKGLRLRVIGGGCSGFSYDLYFDDKQEYKDSQHDREYEFFGLKVYVDPFSHQYIEGLEVDYVDGIKGSGFKFSNPNIKTTCGCGSSFSVDE